MWDVQGVTEALDMGPEDKVIWPKQCLDAVAHLVTNLKRKTVCGLIVKLIVCYTLFVVLNESSLGTYWMS